MARTVRREFRVDTIGGLMDCLGWAYSRTKLFDNPGQTINFETYVFPGTRSILMNHFGVESADKLVELPVGTRIPRRVSNEILALMS